MLRYEPGFSLDLLLDLALPIGEYDSKQSVNLGQNRWYGRIGAPIVWQLGDWVPGRRTTLELLPAVWMFSDNNDFIGKKLKTDPLFQLDAHLTRDFTEHLWGALDLVWYKGSGSTINGVSVGKSQQHRRSGFTLGYTVSENLNLTVGYKSTVQRQQAHRHAHGRVHGHAGLRLAPDHRRHATAEERVAAPPSIRTVYRRTMTACERG